MKVLTLNRPNITNFAKERNDLLKKAKTEWALFIDKDEEISLSVDSLQLTADSYYLKRKNYFLGQYVGTDKIIRLVRKGTGKFVRKVHEVWEPNNYHSRCGFLSGYIIIHNTAENLSDYLKKINNYSDLHAKANLEEGKKSSLFKIIFFPMAKFLLTLLKSKNIVFSIMQSLHSYLAWSKLYFLQH